MSLSHMKNLIKTLNVKTVIVLCANDVDQIYLENARRKKGMKPQKVYLITEVKVVRMYKMFKTFKPISVIFLTNSGSKCWS